MNKTDKLTITVRAYATKTDIKSTPNKKDKRKPLPFSEWALIFDTETAIDASQQLRFGCYQLRKSGKLIEKGIFYDAESLTDAERSLVQEYAESKGFELLTVAEFVEEIFFLYAYKLSALCIGFNLPFDLSRLALRHTTAKSLRGGFSFVLSENRYRPRVRVKHLNSRASLIQFTVPAQQQNPRSQRQRDFENPPPHRGYFLDVKTLASALLSGSWSLKTLAEHLKIKNQKLSTDEHGGTLRLQYLDYAVRDVQATWECFEKLLNQYQSYELTQTPINQIYSEASLGKANLREMGIKPWRELQPDFPPDLIGTMMSAYYGGRSEVHIRRQIVRVLYCDFLSMYPTVCTLMGLWRFVRAEKTVWHDATTETQALLEKVSLKDLQVKTTWQQLMTLVRIQPENDALPIRAKYDAGQYSIGVNHLTSNAPMWYTLADCIASKLLTGRTPRVIQAICFQPQGLQPDLKPIDIGGKPAYRVDPRTEDFYCRLIDLRSEVKANLRQSQANDKARLEAEQMSLKICANATSYGVFTEFNEGELNARQKVVCYGQAEKPFVSSVRQTEEPGRYFHPLLATLITGAARLMLAIAERLSQDAGLTWAFCDTDSMALAKPAEMSEAEFIQRAKQVQGWFTPLNPYLKKEPLFKIEDVNHALKDGKESKQLAPLYCFAVSAKRYALFNLDGSGKPILRKASAHGLGHLLPPYEDKGAPRRIPKPSLSLEKIWVKRWQYDFWYLIVKAALDGNSAQVTLDQMGGFDKPAVSRYSATNPALLRWFRQHNANKPYREQVKPFNFLLSFHANSMAGSIRPVAAFDKDLDRASRHCFDRNTGEPVSIEYLKSYCETLAQYHLHPEAKFDHGDYEDSGFTVRRHIIVDGIEHIGKEANHLEDQWYLGTDLEAQIIYGMAKQDFRKLVAVVIQEGRACSRRKLAEESGLSLREVSRLLCKQVELTPGALIKLQAGIKRLNEEKQEKAALLARVKERCQQVGWRKFAALAGIDVANLSQALKGRRPLSVMMLAKLEAAVLNSERGLSRFPYR